MPAIIGPVQIVNVGGGIVQFGDTLYISPKSNSKSAVGSGSFNTGGFIITNNGISGTNVLDTNLIDQPTVGNN
ncbi:spore germination protein [Cytobacillus spongiae]|uniref:spore germination protein n=1 Tax=Cytobacillus spongiae TaxID=2901381 RepID=UPI001F28E914|nr:spore germination protein [Cytobacillus spongiae]UII56941.1 spore germination protein [Cytobacillus spongiae]